MIGNTLTSFFDNLSTKTKNPFLGTFVIVWLCRNWELVFALFNFDESYTLTSKIEFLSERVKYETFWSELGWNIFWTFFVLIATYTLINLARIITNLFEKKLTPLIYKWTDFASLVPKTEYQDILSRMATVQERLDKEIQERIKIQNEKDKLEKELDEFSKQRMAKSNDDTQQNQTSKNQLKSTTHESPWHEMTKKFVDLINEYGLTHLTGIHNHILDESPIEYSQEYEIIDFFLENGLILLKERGKSENNIYQATDKGYALFKEYF